MKVYQINIFGNLSTGRIATDLCEVLKLYNSEGRLAFARNETIDGISYYKIGNSFDVLFHGGMTRITDRAGFYSRKATSKLIEDILTYQPDVIHLHNLHGYYLNIEELFEFLSSANIPVVWTLHDCWPYTGHCCHYSACGCNKWLQGCHDCPNLSSYPASFHDNSRRNYADKKRLFTSVENMKIVTVSHWLEKEVMRSFLNMYEVETIYNGIDLDVFKPTVNHTRERLDIDDSRRIILGVASTWHKNKGLNDFIELSSILPDDYLILLVGLSSKQIKNLPRNIIGLPRTNSVEELVEIYSAADVFLNASVEETFGLPTIEAIACGTPAVVYNCTALPEVCEAGSGFVVEPHDLRHTFDVINEVCESNINRSEVALNAVKFDKWNQYKSYIKLYSDLCGGGVL